MLSNWDRVREAQEISANSAGTAAEKYEAQMESIEASINKVQNAWEGFTQRLGSNKVLKGFFNVVAGIVKHLDKIIISLTSMLTAMNAYKIGFGGFMNPINKLTNSLNIKHMQFAGSAMQESDKKSIISAGFTKVNANIERLIAVANKIAGIESGGKITTPGFFNLGSRHAQNVANRAQIKALGAQNEKHLTTIDNIQTTFHGKIKANQKEITRLTNQNRFNRRWGMGLGYAAKDKDGNMVYAARSWGKWVDNEGKAIEDPTALESLNAQRKQLIKNQIKTGMLTGAVAGIQAGMSGTNSHFGGLMGSKDVKINDIQSDTTDNFINGVATGAATGLLTAIPGIGPILGPVLGPIIGDGIGGLFKWLRHSEEISIKQRVEDAKKQLEALNKIKNATKEVESAVYDLTTAEKVADAKKNVDELISTLSENFDDFQKLFNELIKIEDTGFTDLTAENFSNIMNHNLEELERILLGDNDDQKRQILNVVENYTAEETAIEKYKTQEEERKSYEKKIEDALKATNNRYSAEEGRYGGVDFFTGEIYKQLGDTFKTSITDAGNGHTYGLAVLKGDTTEAKIESAVEAIERIEKGFISGVIEQNKRNENILSGLKNAVDTYKSSQAAITKLNRDLWQDELKSAFMKSGLAMWSAVDVSNSTLEFAVQKFADNLTLTGMNVRDLSGELTDSARQQIETFLRADGEFNKLFTGSSKTFNNLIYLQTRQEDFAKKINDISEGQYKTYDEIRFTMDHIGSLTEGGREALEKLAKSFYGDESLDNALEKLREDIYLLDDKELENFTNAMKMSTESAMSFKNVIGSITLSDLMKSPKELRESYSELISIFNELSSKGKLSGEILEKINDQYFDLYNKYDENGKLVSTSKENVYENLFAQLFGSQNLQSTQAFLYERATFNSLKENKSTYKTLQEYIKQEGKDNLGLTEDDFSALIGAESLNEVEVLFNNNENLQKILIKFLNDLKIENNYYKELQDLIIDSRKRENEATIENFKTQIDALSDINEQRKKELELIKAKEALENAKKEKRRVYRFGVGWTYEANEESIREAKENIENLERETQKENLQYQIDLLEQQNSILDNISKNEELAAIKKAVEKYDSYLESIETSVGGIDGIGSILNLFGGGESKTIDWGEYISTMESFATQDRNNKKAELKEELTKIRDAGSNMSNMSGQETTSKYIAQQQAQNTAYNNYLKIKNDLQTMGVSSDEIENIEKDVLGNTMNKLSKDDLTNLDSMKEGKTNTADSVMKFVGLKLRNNTTGIWNADKIYRLIEKSEKSSTAYNVIEGFDKNPGSDLVMEVTSFTDSAGKPGAKYRSVSYDEFQSLPDGTVVFFGAVPDAKGGSIKAEDSYAIKRSGEWKRLVAQTGYMGGAYDIGDFNQTSLINELGTEGIVTPQGTITALPAHTGIVPADLTKNLYQLGELSPNLIKGLSTIKTEANRFNSTEDNSMHVNDLNITVNADSDFNFNKLLAEARQYMAITRHNNK